MLKPWVSVVVLMLFGAPLWAQESSMEQSQRLWKILNGTNLDPLSETAEKMSTYIDQGREKKAAVLASRSPKSSTVTNVVRRTFAPIAGREYNPAQIPGDFVLTWMMAAINKIPVEDLFLTDIRYSVSDSTSISGSISEISQFLNYSVSDASLAAAEEKGIISNVKQKYIKNEKQRFGVLTSLQYGESLFSEGTNRRPLKKIAEDLLCVSSIEKLMNFSINDRWVGRDIPRAPGKDPEVYLTRCMGCHAGVDSMRGAFSGYDVFSDSIIWSSGISSKMNNDAHVFPAGHLVTDHSWQHTGWLPIAAEKIGKTFVGPRGLMEMIVESPQFYRCMVQRTQSSLCPQKSPTALTLSQLAYDFETTQEVLDMVADVSVKICLKEGV